MRFWRRSTSTIEHWGSSSASTNPGSPPPLPRSISLAPAGSGRTGRERGSVLGRLLDGAGAEETEALRFTQHSDRLGSHLTPG